MTEVEKLLIEITDSGIFINNMRFKNQTLKAFSACDDEGDCIIVINEEQLEDSAEYKTVLLHEQGHCRAYAFYCEGVLPNTRERLEYRADKYVAENSITKEMIQQAHIKEGFTEAWEFAEFFGITVEYMKRLLYIHFQMEFLD